MKIFQKVSFTLIVLGGSLHVGTVSAQPVAAACQSFKVFNGTAAAKVDADCRTCSASNPNRAIDGDPASSATLIVNGAPAFDIVHGVSLRATTQPGIVIPAGQNPGVLLKIPSQPAQVYNITVRTLLAGVVQESDGEDYSVTLSTLGLNNPNRFSGLQTTKPFDAVEIAIANIQASTAPKFEIFEVCADYR